MSDDELRLTEWLAIVARRHAIVLGSFAAHVAVWIAMPRLWTTLVKMQSRSGSTSWLSAGTRDAMFAGVALAIYVLARFLGPTAGRWGMRPPSDGEVAVARVVLRGACVVAMWVALVIAIRA